MLMNSRLGYIIHWREDHRISFWATRISCNNTFFYYLNQNVFVRKKRKETKINFRVSCIFKKITHIKNGWHSISSNMTKHPINPKHTPTLSAHYVADGTHQLFHSCMHSHFLCPSIFEMHHLHRYTVVLLSIKCNPFSRNSKYLC